MKYKFLASRDEINGIFIQKMLLFFHFIIYNFKRGYDVIHFRTFRHINDDVA